MKEYSITNLEKLKRIDPVVLLCVFAMNAMSIVVLKSQTDAYAEGVGDWYVRVQLLASAAGIVAMLVMTFLDYDALYESAKQERPKLIVAGASAYPREIDFARISAIAKEVGALFMVDMAHIAGLVVAGVHMNPVPYADIVTTTTHKTLRGPRGGLILSKAEYGPAINKAIFPGNQGGPLMHIIAAKAVCFGEALKPSFKAYGEQIVKNSKALANGLVSRGIDLVSGGTDNHLSLLDLRSVGLTGKELEHRLDEVEITTNKNASPNDPEKPFVTSGLRLGTAAVTTRGMNEADMDKIASLIALAATDFDAKKAYIREEVDALCAAYPLYE